MCFVIICSCVSVKGVHFTQVLRDCMRLNKTKVVHSKLFESNKTKSCFGIKKFERSLCVIAGESGSKSKGSWNVPLKSKKENRKL